MIVPHPSLSRPPGTARRRGSSRDSFPHTAPQHTPRERSASERGEVGAEKGEEGLPFLLALVLRAAAACALPARPVADRASACAVRALAGLAAASPNHGGGGARDGGRGQGGPALRRQEVVSVLCIIEGPAFAALLPHADRGDGDAHALAAFAPSHPAGTPSPFGLGTSAPVRCLARPRASLSLPPGCTCAPVAAPIAAPNPRDAHRRAQSPAPSAPHRRHLRHLPQQALRAFDRGAGQPRPGRRRRVLDRVGLLRARLPPRLHLAVAQDALRLPPLQSRVGVCQNRKDRHRRSTRLSRPPAPRRVCRRGAHRQTRSFSLYVLVYVCVRV